MRLRALQHIVSVAFLSVVVPGCSPLFKVFVYTCDRVVDAADMVDFGVSVTPRFSLSAYACLFGLGGLGGGTVNGYFAGIGGSRIGIYRHYHSNIGVILYAYEVTGWGDFDVNNPETLARRHRGPIAWLFIPGGDKCRGAG
ncbi:MAG TPA: hypothetical protein PLE19_05880 [Planctomycetota bacterium]|nr:hypothetical protein [Planctomycetota bacterium]HRR80251.1 hypothetical protein [Planctomycetota bacterium]HRT95617.1 hypothetical protein [Planctomycetota bacterium]